MFGASMIHPIREAAKRFVGANKGNVAVIFTIAAIPVISFVGAAIDYSRAKPRAPRCSPRWIRQP
jgi:Flp pilus assembly protein TadG